MNDIIMWVIIGVVLAGILAFIIYQIVRVCRLSKEDRKRQIIEWLKTAIIALEQELKSESAEEEIAQIEDYFNKHAPWFLKLLFILTTQTSLEDLIKDALKEVEETLD